MEFHQALNARRSCRAFRRDPVDPEVLERILSTVRRGPSAGNTWALDLVVLNGPAETAAYWEVTLPPGPRRDEFAWPALLDAPVLVLVYTRPEAYPERYSEPDKVATGLGTDRQAWSVPYWVFDGGAAVMAVLLAATAEGLGSLFFGQFAHASVLSERFGVPGDRMALGTIAIGAEADEVSRPSRSATRVRPAQDHIVHRGSW